MKNTSTDLNHASNGRFKETGRVYRGISKLEQLKTLFTFNRPLSNVVKYQKAPIRDERGVGVDSTISCSTKDSHKQINNHKTFMNNKYLSIR